MNAMAIRALMVDAAGTLLQPAEPIARTYRRAAAAFGTPREEADIAARFPVALRRHRGLRAGDPSWRAYWHAVVADSTGVDDAALTEHLYDAFARRTAWELAPGSAATIETVRARGMSVAVVSNWDVRLRTLLEEWRDLELDALVVSAEEGIEKPDPEMFRRACVRLNVAPHRAVMVGDSRSNDIEGARAAGLRAWHYGTDLEDFTGLRDLLGVC